MALGFPAVFESAIAATVDIVCRSSSRLRWSCFSRVDSNGLLMLIRKLSKAAFDGSGEDDVGDRHLRGRQAGGDTKWFRRSP